MHGTCAGSYNLHQALHHETFGKKLDAITSLSVLHHCMEDENVKSTLACLAHLAKLHVQYSLPPHLLLLLALSKKNNNNMHR